MWVLMIAFLISVEWKTSKAGCQVVHTWYRQGQTEDLEPEIKHFKEIETINNVHWDEQKILLNEANFGLICLKTSSSCL